jgi:hypothetical protein
MKVFPKRVVAVLLAACGCWWSGDLNDCVAAPVMFAGLFDLNRLVEDVVKDMIQHKQNQQPTNQEHYAQATNSNHLKRLLEADSQNFQNHAAQRVAPRNLPASFLLPANMEWFDTGIVLSAGEAVTVSATGDIYVGNVPDLRLNYETADGSGIETTSDTQFTTPFVAPGLVPWSLVGRIGTNGQPFQAGSRGTIVPQNSGELYLSVNANSFADNSGSWFVSIIAIQKPAQPVSASLQTTGSNYLSQVVPPTANVAPALPMTTRTNPPALLPPPAATTPVPPK